MDGSICADKDWVLRRARATDFIDEEAQIFDLKGDIIKCLNPTAVPDVFKSQLKVELQPSNVTTKVEGQFDAKKCPPLNITYMSGESVKEIILDDKDTPEKADFWLHPFC